MKSPTGCGPCVERNTQDIVCKYANPVCFPSKMKTQSVSSPVQPHVLNLSCKYLPGDGEMKPKRILPVIMGFWNPVSPLDPKHSVVFFCCCFYLETETEALCSREVGQSLPWLLLLDPLSQCQCICRAKWLRLPQPSRLLKNTAALSRIQLHSDSVPPGLEARY